MIAVLLSGLATYHEAYNRSIPVAAASIVTSPKYLLFPEQRATKVSYLFKEQGQSIIYIIIIFSLSSVLQYSAIVIISFVKDFGISSSMT